MIDRRSVLKAAAGLLAVPLSAMAHESRPGLWVGFHKNVPVGKEQHFPMYVFGDEKDRMAFMRDCVLGPVGVGRRRDMETWEFLIPYLIDETKSGDAIGFCGFNTLGMRHAVHFDFACTFHCPVVTRQVDGICDAAQLSRELNGGRLWRS